MIKGHRHSEPHLAGVVLLSLTWETNSRNPEAKDRKIRIAFKACVYLRNDT